MIYSPIACNINSWAQNIITSANNVTFRSWFWLYWDCHSVSINGLLLIRFEFCLAIELGSMKLNKSTANMIQFLTVSLVILSKKKTKNKKKIFCDKSIIIQFNMVGNFNPSFVLNFSFIPEKSCLSCSKIIFLKIIL